MLRASPTVTVFSSLAGLWLVCAGGASAQLTPPGIRSIPERPRAGVTFVLEVESICGGTPGRVVDVEVEVIDDLIRIDAEQTCGPLSAIDRFWYPVVVPPLPAGEYRVEAWIHVGEATPGRPEAVGTLRVEDAAPLAARRCSPRVTPAATLLFPFFEVDTASTDGITTLLALTNIHAEPVLANVVLWSNWALPVASFEVYLAGGDVQTLNLRDVLAGRLPETGPGAPSGQEVPDLPDPPGCDPANVAAPGFDAGFVRAALLGRKTASGCWASAVGQGRATGFVTVDVVRECSELLPADDGYFEAGGTGVAAFTNALLGDFFLVEPEESFAQGEPALHLVADPTLLGPGSPTFYGAMAHSGGADARMPLGRLHATRFVADSGFGGGTEILVWREPLWTTAHPIACGSLFDGFGPPWLRYEGSFEAFDETGRRSYVAAGAAIGPLFPLATQRVPVSGLVPWSSGWLRLDLLGQSTVTAVMRGFDHFSVGLPAGQLDDPCGDLPSADLQP